MLPSRISLLIIYLFLKFFFLSYFVSSTFVFGLSPCFRMELRFVVFRIPRWNPLPLFTDAQSNRPHAVSVSSFLPARLLGASLDVSYFFFFYCLFLRATLAPYGSSQARGWIRAVATGLCHSHSHAGSTRVCDRHHSSQQRRILNPRYEARFRTCMDTRQICFHWATLGTPGQVLFFFNKLYWHIVDLRCWISFRCTAKWFIYTYTYVHSFFPT